MDRLVAKWHLAHMVFCVGGELLTSADCIVGRWRKFFEDVLNSINRLSMEEAVRTWGCALVLLGSRFEEAVKAAAALQGEIEICPEFFKALEVVGLQHYINIRDSDFGEAD